MNNSTEPDPLSVLNRPLTTTLHDELGAQLDERFAALFVKHGIRIHNQANWDGCVIRLSKALASEYAPWLVHAIVEDEPRSAWKLACSIATTFVSGFRNQVELEAAQSKWKGREALISDTFSALQKVTGLSQEKIIEALEHWKPHDQAKFPPVVMPICNAFRREFKDELGNLETLVIRRARKRIRDNPGLVLSFLAHSSGSLSQYTIQSLHAVSNDEQRQRSIIAWVGCKHEASDRRRRSLADSAPPSEAESQAIENEPTLLDALTTYQWAHKELRCRTLY